MISASDLTMRYGKRVLFEKVNCVFKPECRYGLIGANGSGKSTFMKILTGQEEATAGEVMIEKDCSLGYLRQDHYEFDDETVLNTVFMGDKALWSIHKQLDDLYAKGDLTDEESHLCGELELAYQEADGYSMEANAAKLLNGLGISDEFYYEPLSSLTGGFKLRVLLAQVLFGDPDILLMDEPTNHLDMASIDWLVNFLSRRRGTVVLISHDRHFLNSVCTNIADLDYKSIRMFPGNYDDFMTADAMVKERAQKENKKMEKRITELKEFINRFSANASKAKQATSRQKELNRIELNEIAPSSRISPYIRFEPETPLGDRVIELEGISKAYDTTLFKNFTASITSEDKIAIIGKNGAGKTTLLRIMLGELAPDSGKAILGETVQVNDFPQDNTSLLAGDEKAIDWLTQWNPGDEGITDNELRSAMGRMLFRGDDVFKPISVLSGGERARLVIARMLLQGGNLLALDEPTNHLDLESIEAVNYALSLVETTAIFVSHDREFVRSIATRIILIEDGEIIDYPGTLDEFEDWQKRQKRQDKKERK